ncbi:YqjF family protein [Sinomicrobium weinanense]|uniref:DUF2071 domain-containing protein n=1 Tax=Sinomicrobium weinanense TaxID=2842200 RepID=A0A926JVU3_9FLAO|nr:DUF2071 domain-containing protein [Sinomicrobium weinanense]MBC9798254.1 DUF2071 domain-containing protein [Sinomicrobium weinanense]MBU3122641.1 DUF2071 domain-containing protein [Sinomicrobium weinanense]
MTVKQILKTTEHRPWELSQGNWKFYQEWNNAVFLHWRVEPEELKKFVPDELEIDLHNGEAWVSLVAFTMEKIRYRYLPSFPPISDFDEINIRTYVRYRDKPGVYFLSIEGGTKISCEVAKRLSELPYRYSTMNRDKGIYTSLNQNYNDHLNIKYTIGSPVRDRTPLDHWLIERYALFQDTERTINTFDIHHVAWPVYDIQLHHAEVNYPRFNGLIRSNKPDKIHYSTGVQVIAWDKETYLQGSKEH